MSKSIDLRGCNPVYWPDFHWAGVRYKHIVYGLPLVTRLAAGSIYKYTGKLLCQTTIDELHNNYYATPEIERRINLILGPHGHAIVRAYAVQRVESKWWWKCLSRIYPW